MKRLFLLFPLYILFLSGVPCGPNDGCCQEEIRTIAAAGQTASDHDNTKGHQSNLPCSPFFPCGACHGVVIPNHTSPSIQPLPPIAKQPSVFTEKPLLAYAPAIWQPPKNA